MASETIYVRTTHRSRGPFFFFEQIFNGRRISVGDLLIRFTLQSLNTLFRNSVPIIQKKKHQRPDSTHPRPLDYYATGRIYRIHSNIRIHLFRGKNTYKLRGIRAQFPTDTIRLNARSFSFSTRPFRSSTEIHFSTSATSASRRAGYRAPNRFVDEIRVICAVRRRTDKRVLRTCGVCGITYIIV